MFFIPDSHVVKYLSVSLSWTEWSLSPTSQHRFNMLNRPKCHQPGLTKAESTEHAGKTELTEGQA